MGWKIKAALLAVALVGLVLSSAFVYEIYWNDFSTLDHYEALGVNAQATPSEIKRAFRTLSLLYHPDKRDGASDLHLRRFHRISGALNHCHTWRLGWLLVALFSLWLIHCAVREEAYTVLSDDHTRQAYDQQQQYERAFATPTVRFAPRSASWSDIWSFVRSDLPVTMAILLSRLLNPRILVTGLVLLGCIVFALDIGMRLVRKATEVALPGHSKAVIERNDAARLEARRRQQEALVEKSKTAQRTALLRKVARTRGD